MEIFIVNEYYRGQFRKTVFASFSFSRLERWIAEHTVNDEGKDWKYSDFYFIYEFEDKLDFRTTYTIDEVTIDE